MLKKPTYDNENNVELYATENNLGQKKCDGCGNICMNSAEAYALGFINASGNWYCTYCNKSY